MTIPETSFAIFSPNAGIDSVHNIDSHYCRLYTGESTIPYRGIVAESLEKLQKVQPFHQYLFVCLSFENTPSKISTPSLHISYDAAANCIDYKTVPIWLGICNPGIFYIFNKNFSARKRIFLQRKSTLILTKITHIEPL